MQILKKGSRDTHIPNCAIKMRLEKRFGGCLYNNFSVEIATSVTAEISI
jgi:hypothetical protein